MSLIKWTVFAGWASGSNGFGKIPIPLNQLTNNVEGAIAMKVYRKCDKAMDHRWLSDHGKS